MNFNEHQTLAIQTEVQITPELRERFTHMSPLLVAMMVDGLYYDLADTVKRHIFYGSEPTDVLIQLVEAEAEENKDFPLPLKTDRDIRLVHGWLGIVSEIPELAMAIIHRDQKNIGEESGDIKYYGAVIDDASGFTSEAVAKANIAKLKRRYKGKFSQEAAISRDTSIEMQAMEGELDA